MTGPTADQLRVKLYTDGADLAAMIRSAANPRIQGFTTNPTLMRSAGVANYAEFSRKILDAVPDKPISFEVLADTVPEIERQARKIATWGSNVYVKVPITTTDGTSTLDAVARLAHDGVKVNVTAVFTHAQIRGSARALAGGAPSVVSVFAGRIADAGVDPVPHMREAVAICRGESPAIEVLWASPRELFNVVQADVAGCDIITAPESILAKLGTLGKDLVKFSLDTVKMFRDDAVAAGYEL
jgi:transaldolase